MEVINLFEAAPGGACCLACCCGAVEEELLVGAVIAGPPPTTSEGGGLAVGLGSRKEMPVSMEEVVNLFEAPAGRGPSLRSLGCSCGAAAEKLLLVAVVIAAVIGPPPTSGRRDSCVGLAAPVGLGSRKETRVAPGGPPLDSSFRLACGGVRRGCSCSMLSTTPVEDEDLGEENQGRGNGGYTVLLFLLCYL